MTASLTPTLGQIRAQVAAVREKRPEARFIGIRSRGPWTGEEIIEEGEGRVCIRQCDAPIQFRMALCRPPEPGTTMVLITPLGESQLGEDIRVRLAGRRLFPLDPWHIVGWLFGARRIDPRVTAHSWISEMLMELVPVSGYPPVPNRVLDAETVWEILLKGYLGMETGLPDLVSLLKWSADEADVRRWGAASEPFRRAAADWIVRTAGPAAEAILNCVHATPEPLALPAGLALGVIYGDPASGDGNLDRAAGRLEQLTGNPEIPAHQARQWHMAAAELIRTGFPDHKARHAWLKRSDAVLEKIGASDFAHLSPVSPHGFDQRLIRFARALENALSRTPIRAGDDLFDAKAGIFSHEMGREPSSPRMERIIMAARLLRWLEKKSPNRSGKTSVPRDFREAATAYARDGGFVDWARDRIRAAEPLKALSLAYGRLGEAAAGLRDQENQRFAELLRDWTIAGSAGDAALPIESVLERIVSPLLPQVPMLILLMDGMSNAVFQELLESITAREWAELVPAPGPETGSETGPEIGPVIGPEIGPVIAAIPSVTRYSRTSFFTGRLAEGESREEAKNFSAHPALKAASGSSAPPKLFHKIAVADAKDGSLSEEIRNALGTKSLRAVGVVLNAVDDHLKKGDQTDPRWTLDFIRPLSALLYEARAAGRAVLLISDHGHVSEWGTALKSGGEGERWRPAAKEPAGQGELHITGSRVMASPQAGLIALWSEKYRYSVKKNGYHGGLTPQEMLVPIALLSPGGPIPQGWRERHRHIPDWWEEPPHPPSIRQTSFSSFESFTSFAPEPPSKGQLPLFEKTAKSQKPAQAGPQEWLGRLKDSPVYQQQKAISGSTIPDDEIILKITKILVRQGGRITPQTLSRELDIPEFRLKQWIDASQRLLNIEGYPILTKDEAAGIISLDIDLLRQQFELNWS